jgi:hypothetical protein
MMDYLLLFFKYNQLYFFTGAVLLFLVLFPTKKKASPKTQKALYLALAIWVICFAYRINTGQDIIYLFGKKDIYGNQSQPPQIKGGPFNKYYSNDAGRKSKSEK